MAPNVPVYVPTELLSKIAGMINAPTLGLEMEYSNHLDRTLRKRQAALYNFCLVNRQWYSAGVEELYSSPILWAGNSFERFIATVCPHRMKKRKDPKNLNTMIRSLDLRKLVHHSRPSLTARLLNQASGNLLVFYAPRSSFAVNSLAPLTKCSSLVSLDLGLVKDPRLNLDMFKKAICRLDNLRKLTLPTQMYLLSNHQTDGAWPSSLEELKIGGDIDEYIMSRFDWPVSMKTLIISQCPDLSYSTINGIQEGLLNSDSVLRSLERLIIEDDVRPFMQDFQDPSNFLWAFYKLSFLQIPTKLAIYFHLIDFERSRPALSLKTVRFVEGKYPDLDLKKEFMWSVQHGPMSRIWFLQLPSSFMKQYGLDSEKIDDIIMKNMDEVEDEELDRWGLTQGLEVL